MARKGSLACRCPARRAGGGMHVRRVARVGRGPADGLGPLRRGGGVHVLHAVGAAGPLRTSGRPARPAGGCRQRRQGSPRRARAAGRWPGAARGAVRRPPLAGPRLHHRRLPAGHVRSARHRLRGAPVPGAPERHGPVRPARPARPAGDLAAVVRARHDGAELLDTLVTLSVADPTFTGVPEALHEARQGQPARLDRLVAAVRQGSGASAAELSQGLHASTLCTDTPAPWGDSSAPIQGRAEALRRAVDRLTDAQVFPFDRATASGNGIAQTCLAWPPTPAPPAPAPGTKLPPVPVLLLAGDRDLSTPLAWARQEARLAPRGRLVVVPDAGHSVQSRASSEVARHAVADFLNS